MTRDFTRDIAPLIQINLLHHDEIDMAKWDDTIRCSRYPFVFAQSYYLNATSPGWKAMVSGDYETVMPVTCGRKYGISYVMQPPYTSQLGLYGKVNNNLVNEFLVELRKRYRYINIELNAASVTSLTGAHVKRTFMRPLADISEFRSNTKRSIARAVKSGLTATALEPAEACRLSSEMITPFLRSELKLGNRQLKIFDDLLISCSKEGKLLTLKAATPAGEVTAIAHFIFNGIHALYLKGVNRDKKSGAMHYLISEAISIFRNNGHRYFDLGGGKQQSLADFYSGFGASEFLYQTFKSNDLPPLIRLLKR